jgi:Domain of unknown function (DUF4412)
VTSSRTRAQGSNGAIRVGASTAVIAAAAFALVLGLAAPRAAVADLLLLQRETIPSHGGGGGSTSDKEVAIARDMMRIRDINTGMMVIVRLDKRVVWQISPDRTEYIEIPFDYLQKVSGFERMTEEELLEAQLELATPEERPEVMLALEEARSHARPMSAEERAERETLVAERSRLREERPSVEWTGATKQMSGFKAREAKLTLRGAKVAEIWVTKDAFFADELDSYFEAMSSLGQAGGGVPADLATLGGFPVKTVLYPLKGEQAQGEQAKGEQGPPLTIEIVDAKRESLPMWEFDLPPGAARAPLGPGLGGNAP